jgi:hypothetical protein
MQADTRKPICYVFGQSSIFTPFGAASSKVCNDFQTMKTALRSTKVQDHGKDTVVHDF